MNSIWQGPTTQSSADDAFHLQVNRYETGAIQSVGDLGLPKKFETLSAALKVLLDNCLHRICPGMELIENSRLYPGSLEIRCQPSGYRVSVGLADVLWETDEQAHCNLGIITEMPLHLFRSQVKLEDKVFLASDSAVFIPLLAIGVDNSRIPFIDTITSLMTSLQNKAYRNKPTQQRSFITQRTHNRLIR